MTYVLKRLAGKGYASNFSSTPVMKKIFCYDIEYNWAITPQTNFERNSASSMPQFDFSCFNLSVAVGFNFGHFFHGSYYQ